VVPEHLVVDENKEVKEICQIIDKDPFWLCISCNKVMRNDIIFCEKCQVFKPLEMYKHLLHEPENVT
jgi:hypothetical protein